MGNRERLLLGVKGLLYLGPLLAGLMGQGWPMVPAFLFVFLLASVILHPEKWPLSAGDLTRPDAALALAALVATQALLVILAFAIGRGIGGVLAAQPALPAYLPLALSFLSVPLSRLIQGRSSENLSFVPLPQRPAPHQDQPESLPTTLLAELALLPDDVPEDVLQSHLTAASNHLDPALIRAALGAATSGGKANRATLKALIIHATDPSTADLLSGTAYPALAFATAGQDDDLLTLFATRCTRLLGDEPDLAPDCPSGTAIAAAAQAARSPTTASDLHRLAGLLP